MTPWQLWNNHHHQRHEIDCKISQIVMGIVRAQQEQANRDCQKELFCGGVLVAVIDLFPHVEVVVGTGVEFKGNTADPVEHQV